MAANQAKIQGLKEFERKLRQTPERIKRRKVKAYMRNKALPVRNEMRAIAYQGLQFSAGKKTLRKASDGGQDWQTYNLAGSINVFASLRRATDTVAVFIGVRSTKKKPGGAPYAVPFLRGRFERPNPKWKEKSPPKLDYVNKTRRRLPQLIGPMSKEVERYINRELRKVWK